MMRTGLNVRGCHSAETVMVGDRMDTDVIFGMECGMSTTLALPSVSDRNTIDTFPHRPTMVLDGVGDLAAIADTQENNTQQNAAEGAYVPIQAFLFTYISQRLFFDLVVQGICSW